ncbi:MAG TPA: serine hydrolase, partial [Casimicrobiaceae bacterium]|nr:serine hydrolase [Casimicrobiaceae bacterium]
MFLRLLAASAFAVAVCLPAVAATAPSPPPAAAVPAPGVAAAAYLLLDFASGAPIVAQNADERRDPASLTKLMTAYLVFAALKDGRITPAQMVTVSTTAWHAEGSRMFIEPRRAVSVDELMRGVIVQSGNDASIALAELVAGSEAAFVARMNAEAKR